MKRNRISKNLTAALLACMLAGTGVLPGHTAAAEMADDILAEDEFAEDTVGEILEQEAGVEESALQPGNAGDAGDLIDDAGVKSWAWGDDLDEARTAEAELEAEEEARMEKAREEARKLREEQQAVLGSADPLRIEDNLSRLLEEPDPTGSDGELEVGAYIRAEMERLGYMVSEKSFHEGFLNKDRIDIPGVNIVAERGANSETRTDDIFVICAHYDSKTDPEEGDLFANDKSGAAVLMECARLLAEKDTDVDLCFAFLSGEEDGNYGSERFAEYLAEETELAGRIRAVICVGSTGYVRGDED